MATPVAVTVAPPCDDDGRERTGNYLLVDIYGMSLAALGSDLVWGGRTILAARQSALLRCSWEHFYLLLGALFCSREQISAQGRFFCLDNLDPNQSTTH
jgi:hypothetical protein